MQYASTRSGTESVDFQQAVMSAGASKGGLYVPLELPFFTEQEISSWSWLNYEKLAYRIAHGFVGDSIPPEDFKGLLKSACASFKHRSVAPLHQIDKNEWVLELFHGPTNTSKDFAAQFQRVLVDYYLAKGHMPVAMIGATNGTTGLATIEAFKNDYTIPVLVFFPKNGLSEDQLHRLSGINYPHVHKFIVEGSFDDCQEIVAKVLRGWPINSRKPVSFNSNNWSNIIALIVLYFHAALQLGGGQRPIGFSVPAASFAEVYAGYIAQKMGLPINQIIVATNKNDALHQFFQQNKYSRFQSDRTLSPAMDFSIFANVERFIWELYQHSDRAVIDLMQSFEHTGEMTIANKQWLAARMIIDSYSVSDAQTIEEMMSLYRDINYVIDPHTAIGVVAAKLYRRSMSTPMVTLGEISPLKSSSLLTQLGIPMASQQLPATGFSVGNNYYIKPDDIEEVNQVIMGL